MSKRLLSFWLFVILLFFGLIPGIYATPAAINVEEDRAFRDVDTPEEIEKIIKDFQESANITGLNIQVLACDNAVIFYGYENYGRDYSYGASCKVQIGEQKRTLFMCDDVMVGKFAIQTTGTRSKDWIRNLIKNTCPPGG